MTGKFKDHFSAHAQDYGQYRPDYPEEMFSYLSSLTSAHQVAWDCATGNGQAAGTLAEHFHQVIATDASAEQVGQATPIKDVEFRCATAENSSLENNSVDLITVAQALHWFDMPAFACEVERVLVDGGVLAVWTYGLMNIQNDIDELILRLYRDVVGPYWPFERTMVENGYADIVFPFTELETPAFEMGLQWDLGQVMGYLNTWSAVKAYEKDKGENPLQALLAELSELWGDSSRQYSVTWPLKLRVWRKP